MFGKKPAEVPRPKAKEPPKVRFMTEMWTEEEHEHHDEKNVDLKYHVRLTCNGVSAEHCSYNRYGSTGYSVAFFMAFTELQQKCGMVHMAECT